MQAMIGIRGVRVEGNCTCENIFVQHMSGTNSRRNPLLRLGLVCLGLALSAFVWLLVYNHGLEDSFPFWLYISIWITLPVGAALCLVSLVVKMLRRF